jgi:hypothetical protein
VASGASGCERFFNQPSKADFPQNYELLDRVPNTRSPNPQISHWFQRAVNVPERTSTAELRDF